jgi:hypothetical protein
MSVTGLLFESPVAGKPVVASFDGGRMSSDGGLLLAMQTEQRIGLLRKLAGCLVDKRDRTKVRQTVEAMLTQRIFGIMCGYEDCNDFGPLREDPMFKLAVKRSPERGLGLASQPTLSRLENSVGKRELFRMAEALVDVFIESHSGERVKRIILDADGTDDPAHGQQEFEFFNRHYDCHCFLPLLVYATVETEGAVGMSRSSSREQELVCALLRTGKASAGQKALALVKRLVGRLRTAFPGVEIVFRGDSGFSLPDLYAYLDDAEVGYAISMGKNSVLLSKSEPYLVRARRQRDANGEVAREFADFVYKSKGWNHARRVVVKAEVLPDKENPRYVVTNLDLNPEAAYEFYTERGDVENRIKELKDDLFSGRTSCHRFLANQFRLLLHAAALVLIQAVRRQFAGSEMGRIQAGNMRCKLFKVAARVVETSRRIVIHLPTSYPWQTTWARLFDPA